MMGLRADWDTTEELVNQRYGELSRIQHEDPKRWKI